MCLGKVMYYHNLHHILATTNVNSEALSEAEFVDGAIAELVLGGYVKVAKEQPAVCSPLRGGDKKHLVANLRHVNPYLKLQKFKYKDLCMAMLLFKCADVFI